MNRWFIIGATTGIVIGLCVHSASAAEPILVDFRASWCKPCQAMKPVLEKLKADGVDVRSVDCSNAIPRKWQSWVKAVPTFIVYDRRGRARSMREGMQTRQTLLRLLREAER